MPVVYFEGSEAQGEDFPEVARFMEETAARYRFRVRRLSGL